VKPKNSEVYSEKIRFSDCTIPRIQVFDPK